MKHKLKKGIEAFEVVDGPFAGKKFQREKTYDEIPPQEKGKFEALDPTPPAASPGKRGDAKGQKKESKS